MDIPYRYKCDAYFCKYLQKVIEKYGFQHRKEECYSLILGRMNGVSLGSKKELLYATKLLPK